MLKKIVSLVLFFSSLVAGDPKLCLTMIVKNESKIIERLLDSVKGVVDCISICDTGSSDNTIELIENYMKTHNIPGKVHRHVWKNFGHNRSLSALAAQETIREVGLPPADTYMLFLDADMILKTTPQFDKVDLMSDGYQLLQKMGTVSYYNIRLARASFSWECVGVTHEYWRTKEPSRIDKMDTLYIDDRGDGGAKGDKYERDIALLKQGLIDEPENSRYMLYLAQSYRDTQNYPLSLEYYEKRVNAGGWQEEVFESLLQIALIQERLKMPFDKVVESYKRAYMYRPCRSEPLYHLSRYYRNNGKFDLAYQAAKTGLKIPHPKHDILFIGDHIYDWGMKLELSVSAYWSNKLEESKQLCLELLQQNNLPPHVRELVNNNLKEADRKMSEHKEGYAKN